MKMTIGQILLCSVLLAACAGTVGLVPDEAKIDDVYRTLGEPAASYRDPDGGSHLAYPQGPAGFQTIMVHIAADGGVRSVENVLNESHFAAIAPGMDQERVLRRLGPPQPHWTVYFKARDELAWEWRYCDAWNAAARFSVLFDATAGTVRSTVSVRENCNLGDCLCAR